MKCSFRNLCWAYFYHFCWFSLNNSETLRAVTLEFCSIQQRFIRNIRAKISINNSSQSADTRQNSYGGISDFRISGQSLIIKNCHNSRTSDDIDMKLGPVAQLGTEKPIYGQFGAIRKPDSGQMKSCIFINNILLSYKN